MGLSVITPIGQSLERTKKILFDPFDIKKWFILGFCAWLANLGEGYGGGGSGGGGRNRGQSFGSALSQAREWAVAHVFLILFITAVILLIILALWLLVTWLSSRGKFMFLDGVVHNRAAVKRPWAEFKPQGNSLFLFVLVFDLLSIGLVLSILVACGVIAWPDLQAGRFDGAALLAVVLLLSMLIPLGVICLLVMALVKDFVVPVMYLRRVGVIEGWTSAFREIIQPYIGSVVLFYLMKILLGIVALMITFVVCCAACCVTCCIAMLPYLSTVLLLPLHVFWRCYPLYFIEPIGPQLKLFPTPRRADDLTPDYPV